MFADRASRAEVAARIVFGENRHTKLSLRIKSLKAEGSDASQEEEVLDRLTRTLTQLYQQQATMRRIGWTLGAGR
jgi:hypothetical protein